MTVATPGLDFDAIATVLRAGVASSAIKQERPLGELTTYRVGGAARLFVEVHSLGDLDAIGQVVQARRLPVAVLGKGSNLLVADRGFDGLVVRLGEEFASVAVGGTSVRAGAAAALPVVARQSVAAGCGGFEWAVGVPGSMGGAVRMNAGGHGSDMAASVRWARVVDLDVGAVGEIGADALAFGYRASSIAPSQVVVEVQLELAEGDPDTGAAELSEIVRWRRAHQPGGQNAGSVFTNPPGDSAGRLIDATGLKGLRVGSAAISEKHANFIQVDPGGRADDVAELMVTVIARVRAATGVELHPETVMLGFDEGTG